MEAQSIAVIGAGAVGSALARRLAQCGLPVSAVVSRTPAHAASVAQAVDTPVASDSLADIPDHARTVFLCVPDGAIEQVARDLACRRSDWSGVLVAHTSGVLTSDALRPAVAGGAEALSFHPAQSFTVDTGPDAFDGIFIGIEGSESAVARGRRLAEKLGARPIVITADDKIRYHLAASTASNFFVALMALAREMLASTVIDAEPSELLYPLVERTWRNLAEATPEEALSGPVVRGDAATVMLHLGVLRKDLPHLLPAYAALALETLRVAVRSERLTEEDARPILQALEAVL